MPETAKILAFPSRENRRTRTAEEASRQATAFLLAERSDRSSSYIDEILSDADVLTALLAQLWRSINIEPARVADEAPAIYQWLAARDSGLYFFDEREYFMGEAALLAGGSCRHLGRRSESEGWFERADANFRNTIAPAAHLARVSYNRLALRHDMNRHEDVLELLPSTALAFRRLGMKVDLDKCVFLEAMSLRMLGRSSEAASRLEQLISDSETDAKLKGLALINLGNLRSSEGDFQAALEAYRGARSYVDEGRATAATADLKMVFGETLRALGRVSDAVVAYREAIRDLVSLGMETRVAYFRVALAEALLEVDKPREAEWELLAALPTIDQQKMVPEGFAAIALLRESLRQRQADPKALLELRQYLQATN